MPEQKSGQQYTNLIKKPAIQIDESYLTSFEVEHSDPEVILPKAKVRNKELTVRKREVNPPSGRSIAN